MNGVSLVFFNRLKWFTIAMTAVAVLIVVRLIDIQVVRAAEFEALADRMLTRPTVYLSAPRGSILDRDGRPLVEDTPSADIAVHYAVIRAYVAAEGRPATEYAALPAETRDYLRAIARQQRRDETAPPDLDVAAHRDWLATAFADTWGLLAELTGTPPAVLLERAERIDRRVQSLKRHITARNPTVRAIREEHELHPLVRHADEQQALRVRLELGDQPWIRVQPGSQRMNRADETLTHLLGRLGSASAERIEQDPLREDDLRGLRARDLCGISGIERVCDLELRGTRGRIVYSLDPRDGPSEQLPASPGHDIRLTIDSDLQRAAYDIVAEGVQAHDHPCGGAAVVLDANTREVLALVSYPSYPAADYREHYRDLLADVPAEPLRFRAVQNRYPPGSTCKVISLYGALADGVLTEHSEVICDGPFNPRTPNAFRCWMFNTYGQSHGPRDATTAIRDSCNPYFYTAGDRLGPARLTEWFRTFGLGRTQGTGLIEESAGLVPDDDWMRRNRRSAPRLGPADAWNFSIGQGEIGATPLQAANVAATMATGHWEPVRLLLSASGGPRPSASDAAPRTFDANTLRPIRAGMHAVVNGNGTAKVARLTTPGYEMCGKTGSAQTSPRTLSNRWTVEWPDGTRQERIHPVHVGREAVLAEFDEPRPKIVGRHAYERFPTPGAEGGLPAHAWFIGYTQSKSTPEGAAARGRCYAIAVCIEFGDSGGQKAGPVARDIADYLLARQQEWGRASEREQELQGRERGS